MTWWIITARSGGRHTVGRDRIARLAMGSTDQTARVWDAATGTTRFVVTGQKEYQEWMQGLAFRRSGCEVC